MKGRSSDRDFNADIDFLVVTVDDALRDIILRRKKMFEALKGEDEQLLEIYFWSSHAEYITSKVAEKKFGQEDKDYAEDYPQVVEEVSLEGEEVQRTEVDQMIIRGGGVSWTAMPKHTDIYIIGDELSYNLLGQE